MVISNWVEKQLEDRRTKREQMLIEQGREQGFEQGLEQGLEQGREEGREEGFEQGRAFERERIANGLTDDEPPHSENGR